MQKKNKKTKDEIKNNYYLSKYGISYAEVKERSKDGCECCGNKEWRLNVDHIHIKRFKEFPQEQKRLYVRGICCFICNTGFKSVEKFADGKRNRQQLNNMVRYFTKYRLKGET